MSYFPSTPSSPWYRELPPSEDLAPWVSHYRIIHVPAQQASAPAALRLLTDACAGLVIDCTASATSPSVFVGVMHSALVVPVAAGHDLIGVRFHPGAALPFAASSLRELTGRRVPLPLLWGSLANRMGDAVRARTLRERVHIVEDALRTRLQERRRTSTTDEIAVLSNAIARMSGAAGARLVSDVAAELGVGERRLERIFSRTVGVPPKVFLRIRRCGEAARIIRRTAAERSSRVGRSAGQQSWSTIAAEGGYADQAHFIREFRALTGVTPAAYARESHPVGFMQYDGARPA